MTSTTTTLTLLLSLFQISTSLPPLDLHHSSTSTNHTSNQHNNNWTLLQSPPQDQDIQGHFSHQWAVHIPGGHQRASELASKHGFTNTGEIFSDYYHFVHRKVAKRSLSPHHETHQLLSSEPEVIWHAQQLVKSRKKRDFLQFSNPGGIKSRSSRRAQAILNDPRWPAMWYLNRGPGLDMNVQEAWDLGITGKGIVVTILDDGLEKDHPDIVRNYDPLASFDVNSLDNDPMPTYDLTDSNRHGTRCAGEVAAEANNSICSVGIAYEAGVGGVRMLDGDVTDAVEARSLSHNPQHIDIYSASWGPDDDGKTVDGPGELATRAFYEGISKGRAGKGSIFVWASGNGGRDHDNCNCDGYTNSIWTLSISSATENGLVPWYSEACSSTLATTYSSGGTGEKQIVTIDLHHSCTSSHTGTSASAPLAAGICALALEANTEITWRDMQHIVVRTARPHNLVAPDWVTNGVGRNVSHSFGYGLMDAGAMVRLAKVWKTVPDQNKCEVRAMYTDKNIPAKSKVTLDLKVSECPGVTFLEHVQAKVTLTSGRRGDLQIFLISPSGTRSVLLAHRRHDLNRSGFTDWPFMTVHSWGERPTGKWTLEIQNEGRYAGKLQTWTLIAHGIPNNPNDASPQEESQGSHPPIQITPVKDVDAPTIDFEGSDNKITIESSHVHSPPLAANSPGVPDVSDTLQPSSDCSRSATPGGKCLVCGEGLYLMEGHCSTSCPDSFFANSGVCYPCHPSCLRCSGGTEMDCMGCHPDSVLVDNSENPKHSQCMSNPPLSLNFQTEIDSNQFWYKALLTFLVMNLLGLIFILTCLLIRRARQNKFRNSEGSNDCWFWRGSYTPVAPEDDQESVPTEIQQNLFLGGSSSFVQEHNRKGHLEESAKLFHGENT